jgi:hypothetical protein
MDCRIKENQAACPCKATDCPRHGICCECIRAHLEKQSLPACAREQEWIDVKA